MNLKKLLLILLTVLILGLFLNYLISGTSISDYKMSETMSIFSKLCLAFLGLSMLIVRKKDKEKTDYFD